MKHTVTRKISSLNPKSSSKQEERLPDYLVVYK